AGIPTRLVPADVTVRVWLTDADVEALERSASPLHAALARAVRVWSPLQRNLFAGLGAPLPAGNAAFLHDPLALACAHDESFCSIEELTIEPVTVEGVLRTRVCAPGAAGGFRMRCATAVDAPRFTAHVGGRLGIGASEIGCRAGEQRTEVGRQPLRLAVVVHQGVLGLAIHHPLVAAPDLVRDRDARATERAHAAADLEVVVVARGTAIAAARGDHREIEAAGHVIRH